MSAKDTEQPIAIENDLDNDSVDERGMNESTPFLQPNEEATGAVNNENQRPKPAKKWLTRDRLLYGSLFSIPILLFVPSLIFFIMTLNLRATLPPPASLEIISNLTRQVKGLSKSLSTCETNSTRLALELHDEQQRVDVCRESEKRLAERVVIVENMLELCQNEEVDLKEQLRVAHKELGMCVDEREVLKKQMESGVFVQFIDMVGKMGTGGDSWVCSDTTPLWSFGYTSDNSPHPTINIKTWTAELTDAQHSTEPLVFPPPLPSLDDSQPSAPSPSYNPSRASRPNPAQRRLFPQARLSSEEKLPHELSRLSQTADQSNSLSEISSTSTSFKTSTRIIGFTVTSSNISGNNGWWRITKLPAFGMKDGTIEFFALAAKWYKSKAQFMVTVYWIEEGDG